MTLSQALSKKGIDATIGASEQGKERFGDNFKSSTVTRLLKNGYWATIETKDGKKHKLTAKTNGKLTVTSFKEI